MDTKSKLDDAPALAWILAIEALASSDQVDTSLLLDLIKQASEEIWDRFGENARERVCFRILESLSAQSKGVTGNASPYPDSKVGNDPSESCVNVLRQILLKSSGSSKESAKLEMLKWDIESVIQHKKSCLPKSFLEQLKAAILEDNILIPKSLKERSGLVIKNQCGGSDGNVQENQPTKNLLPPKRVRDTSTSDNQLIADNAYDPHSNAAKTLHLAIEEQNSDTFLESRIVKHTGRESSAVSKEPQLGAVVESNFPEDGNDEYLASNMLRISSDVDDAELLNNQQQAPFNDDKLLQSKSGEGEDVKPISQKSTSKFIKLEDHKNVVFQY